MNKKNATQMQNKDLFSNINGDNDFFEDFTIINKATRNVNNKYKLNDCMPNVNRIFSPRINNCPAI